MLHLIWSSRDALQRVRDAISQQVSAVFQFYEKNTDTLDIAGCVSRSAICPSISDMLEWLQDADRCYRLQYPLSLIPHHHHCWHQCDTTSLCVLGTCIILQ